MNWKELIKGWLTFSKKDRIGGFVIIAMMMLFVYLLPKLLSNNNDTVAIVPNNILDNAIDSLNTVSNKKQNFYGEEEESNNYQYEPSKTIEFIEGALFEFDPNSISLAGWKKLGLNDRTIKTINNYRNKGGKFYKAEDLKKIWGLPEAFYNRVEKYINIKTNINKENNFQGYTYNTSYEKKERTYNAVNINASDTSGLIALPGIGSKLATRIVNFRDKLGGFYSIKQVGETYGLPDSTFQKIKSYLKIDENEIKKININTATKDQLKMHPYIKWSFANAIVEYRNQHGNFKSLEDLKNIELIDETTFQKMVPYLSF